MPTPTQGGRARCDLFVARPRLVSTMQLWWTAALPCNFFRKRPWDNFLCNLFIIFLKKTFQASRALADHKTDGSNELTEIEDDGGETDRLDVLSEVQEPGGVGEADGRDELSEVVKAGGVTDPVDALLVVENVGENGEADWMEAPLERFFERICKQCGAFEMPKISSRGRLLAYQAFLRGFVVGMFSLSFGRELAMVRKSHLARRTSTGD